MTPYYVGTNLQLPKGKRGRCVIPELLTREEARLARSEKGIIEQTEENGYYVIETWECPRCFANIQKVAGWRLTMLKHECPSKRISSGAYVAPTLTTSGKRFRRSQFMLHVDVLKLAKQYLEIVAKREQENARLWKREK